ncbi:hypothetical protein L6Q21_08205 [Sandaracinobacter sp. RS1-74]|uniref:hypothetical protein n=1 Tax=Sandaracinobacteroides sayramensis TaxID=2913411 RepID=UPI001EDB1252|nr:hypothetical protein [Sandaracinobacteroides sayramensis]MCG2840962.1 hypothetical protein [Sandaracinobacteroides sayramensis]
MERMPALVSDPAVTTEMAIGTSCRLSARFCAVTMMSSISPLVWAAADAAETTASADADNQKAAPRIMFSLPYDWRQNTCKLAYCQS